MTDHAARQRLMLDLLRHRPEADGFTLAQYVGVNQPSISHDIRDLIELEQVVRLRRGVYCLHPRLTEAR